MEERKLNEKESLELIAQMIQNTKNRMETNCGMPFLLWGYTTVFTSLLVWLLVTYTQNNNWQYLWFMLPTYRRNRNLPLCTQPTADCQKSFRQSHQLHLAGIRNSRIFDISTRYVFLETSHPIHYSSTDGYGYHFNRTGDKL